MMTYFGAGPAKIPQEVLHEVQQELLNYQDSGLSVMELSHRSPTFSNIINKAERDLRELLNVPDQYAVLFLQGGATGQFAAVPLNLSVNGRADYIVTGTWSQKASEEASRFTDVLVLFSSNSSTPCGQQLASKCRADADYVYYCDNETIGGVEFSDIPEVGDVPLVVDISSNILTRSINVSKFGVLIAGAQKNLGPAGVTLAVIRQDLLQRSLVSTKCPAILNYATMHKAKSILNTPPCFNIYVVGKVLSWVIKQGGVDEMQIRSSTKSQLLYDTIDNSGGFYVCPVERSSRSRTTVCIRLQSGPDAENKFLEEAEDEGFTALKGHRSVGGIRVALFNAISLKQVEALTQFMKHFMSQHQKIQQS